MISARAIVQALGGKWRGASGMCKCPAHDDASPSLNVTGTRDGRPLVHCHAGCSQGAVIDALRARGLWNGEARVDPAYPGRLTTLHDGHRDNDERERQEYARQLWDKASPIKGTLGETYLRGRGINRTDNPALRYLPRLKHGPSGKEWPCMIAALTDARGSIAAVQRTWLAKDGQGKAPVEPQKMTLGPMGNAAVRLGAVQPILGLAEGVETALSAKQLYQIPVWATLSANRLAKIVLPPEVESLVIFADHGEVGMREAMSAADHYEREGMAVDVMPPRVHFGDKVSDFNDAVRVDA